MVFYFGVTWLVTWLQVVFYFGVLESSCASPAGRLLDKFIAASDAFRNARLKLIPTVAEVRAASGAVATGSRRERHHRGAEHPSEGP